MTAELRDLVDQLTREHKTPVYQHGELLHYRTDPPLLTALSTARASNTGASGLSNSTAAHERSTLNIAASELFAAIQKRVKQWAHAAEVPNYWVLATGTPVDWRDPAALLRAWHTRTLGNAHLDERPYLDTLQNWIATITDLVIDPPRRFTLNATCPLCNHRWTIDPDGHQIDTLTVTERDPATETTTTCRNCNAVWHGINGARQLRIAIDDAAQAVA